MDKDGQWLTRAETAEVLGVDIRTVDRWAKDTRIPLTKTRLRNVQWVRYAASEVAALLAALKAERGN